MIQPLVSVLIPCYNATLYLEDAVCSILNQTYKNLELIVINDCSTDNTGDILKQLANKDKRIKIITNETNLKLIDTLNKGVQLCNGDFIARMDSDDISLPTRIEKQVDYLQKNIDCDIVGTLFNTFRTDKPNKFSLHTNPLKNEELQGYMLFKSGICHPSVMIRRRVFDELKLRFEKEYLHVEDYAFWSKAIYKTQLANIGEPLLLYRIHANQVSTLHDTLQEENKKKVFAIHLNELGIENTPENLHLHASVASCVPREVKSKKYLKSCENYMLDLLKLNENKHFCKHDYLKKMLSIHWLRLCANSQLGFSSLKTLKQSPLYVRNNYTMQDMAIMYFKISFKIKYKQSKIYSWLYS